MRQTNSKAKRSRKCAGVLAGAALVLAFLMAGAPLPGAAQGLSSNFAGYKGNANKPINIEADLLEVDDQKKQATFKGNVLAKQGDFTLRAKELVVFYSGKPTTANAVKKASAGAAAITRIQAKGKVLISTKDKQTATSDWANFDVKAQQVTIGGNVVLSQGENVIRGDRLVIDLVTGRSRFEVKNANGKKERIRGLFLPKNK